MTWKMTLLAAPVLAVATFAAPVTGGLAPARAACDPGERIDGTTAAWAAGKAREAGYSQIRMEHKGCDNYWHGTGTKDGQDGRFVVSPQGEVLPEGD